jgi:MFS family permease
VPGPKGLVAGCTGLVLGMGILALGLALSALALLLVGGCVAGFGQGLSFRAGLGAVNQQSPADRRAAVASTFFVIAYIAISLPVIGVGVLAQAISLKASGLIFSGIVMLLAAVAAGLLLSQERGSKAQAVDA